MAVNPKAMLQLRERLNIFNAQHPKFGLFLQSIGSRGIEEGTVVELKVTRPDGEEAVTNIRLTADDVETIRMAQQFRQ